jgi:hypothetical protein
VDGLLLVNYYNDENINYILYLGNLLHVEVTKNGFRILFQKIESKDYLENQEVCDQVRKITQHLQER